MTDGRRSFSDEVRQELARIPVSTPNVARAELSAIVRVAGTITLRPATTRVQIDVTSRSGAVARRTHALVAEVAGIHAQLLVRAAAREHGASTFRVRMASDSPEIARHLGLLDDHHQPIDGVPDAVIRPAPVAWLRGAFLAGGSLSLPGRPPHFEWVFTHDAVAEACAATLATLAGAHAHVVADRARRRRVRVVVKSGEVIGELLVRMGASRAFLTWDDHRLRHQLRAEATRLANADAANLRRTINAATAHVRAVERVVAQLGWDGLDDDLRDVALARLANPTVSLAELGALLDPPVGKSTVRRRLERVVALDPHASVDPS